MGSTTVRTGATSYHLGGDKNNNLIENDEGKFGCIERAPYYDVPANGTVLISKAGCQQSGNTMVECIQTPQYNMCLAGDNKVIQQCGEIIVFSPSKQAAAGGKACGPSLNFFIENC